MVTRLQLKFACMAYEWVKPIISGEIVADGIEISTEVLPPSQTFPRTLGTREFDMAELGLTYYVSSLDHNPAYVAIPIFPLRLFRLSSIYVRTDSPFRSAGDLAGKRLGEVFVFGHDAGIWARGILRDHHGLRFEDNSSYLIGGVGQPTKRWDWAPGQWPTESRAQHIGDGRTLDAMLEAGEIDALFSVLEPPGLHRRPATVRRLFTGVEAVEKDYFRKTGIFPIMHTLVIRKKILDDNPWVAESLYKAFAKAKEGVLARERVQEYVPLSRMLPLYAEHQREIGELMGQDYWPYGLGPNRPTLEAFLGYHHDLGLSKRRYRPEELFLPKSLAW